MRHDVVLARSETPDKQGQIFSDGAIKDLVRGLNGSRAVRTTVEHDPALLPLMKVAGGTVVADGDHLVAIAHIVYADRLHLVAGTSKPGDGGLVLLDFGEDRRAFVPGAHLGEYESTNLRISADPMNFDSYDQFSIFRSEVEYSHNATVEVMGRKSLIPEPMLEFLLQPQVVTGGLILYWLGRRALKVLTETVDLTLRNVITVPLAACLSDVIKAPLSRYNKSKSVDPRKISVVAHVLVDCEITLVFRLAPHEDFVAMDLNQLITSVLSVEEWLELADSATFVYENGVWSFCYLTTCDGRVLGSMDALGKTIAAFNATRKDALRLVITKAGDLTFQEFPTRD